MSIMHMVTSIDLRKSPTIRAPQRRKLFAATSGKFHDSHLDVARLVVQSLCEFAGVPHKKTPDPEPPDQGRVLTTEGGLTTVSYAKTAC
jgi:hypothetical protein